MSFDDEVELLRMRGHDVIVYQRNNRELAQLSTSAMVRKLFWNRETYSDIKELIQKHNPDVMHCTNTFPLLSVSIYDAANEHNVPVVQSFRNYRLFCANSVCVLNGRPCQKCLGTKFAFSAIWNKCYRKSRAASFAVACLQAYLRFKNPWKHKVSTMYTLSEFARAKLVEAGLPAEKIFIKPNFVNDPVEDPGDGSGGFAVFAGRLSHEKGIQTLLDSWQKLKIPLKLLILGDGPLRNLVIESAKTDDRIVWKGRCPKDVVFETIGKAKFLVIPSISYETFGRTIIEAYSMNTPVIGSDGGAIAENIIDGITGLRFKTGNVDDLVEKVTFLASQDNLLAQMRINAGNRFREKYTQDENYNRLIEIYNKAIGRKLDSPRKTTPVSSVPTTASTQM